MTFEPDDFKDCFDNVEWEDYSIGVAECGTLTIKPYVLKVISALANAKLKEWMDAAPTVYAHNDNPPIYGTLWTLEPAKQMRVETHHTAKLVCIEEIKNG